MVGRTIGKYRIVEQIGKGGMGTVYAAMDETLDRRVAIKVPHAAETMRADAAESFLMEARNLARLGVTPCKFHIPFIRMTATRDAPCKGTYRRFVQAILTFYSLVWALGVV